MSIIFFGLLGLILGSFVNALVWRVHAQEAKKKSKVGHKELSVLHGRSMCPYCKHTLAAKDLVPVLSWLSLGGKCRYCHKPISWQYPVVELLTSALFVLSYLFWPLDWNAAGTINFAVWLIILVGFMALIVYDLRWMLLPDRIVYPLLVIGGLLALFNIIDVGSVRALIETLISVAIAGGIFYGLFVISNGRWIGGGDVKLGLLIGLVLGDPYLAFLMLMTASLLGTLVALPGMVLKKVSPSSRIPFGPFLIVATILVQLFGTSVIEWYKRTLLVGV